MIDETWPGRANLPIDVLDRIDGICDRFEDARKQGMRPRIEDYLGEVDVPYRHTLLADLLSSELDARRRRGERPQPGEYRDRFPDALAAIEAAFAESPIRPASDPTGSVSPSLVGPAPVDADNLSHHGRFLPGTRIAGRYRIVSLAGKG